MTEDQSADRERQRIREALVAIARLASDISTPELRYLAGRRLQAVQREQDEADRARWTRFPPHPDSEPETRDDVASDVLKVALEEEFKTAFTADVVHWFNTESQQVEWGACVYRGGRRTGKPAAWDRGGTAERACHGVTMLLRGHDPELGLIAWPGDPGRYDDATLDRIARATESHEELEERLYVPAATKALQTLKPLAKVVRGAQKYRRSSVAGDGLRILLPIISELVDEEIESTRFPIRYARVPGADRGRPRSRGQDARQLLSTLNRTAGEAAIKTVADPQQRPRARETIKRAGTRARTRVRKDLGSVPGT